MSRRPPSAEPLSLHRTWTRAVAKFVGLIVALAVVAYAATDYQRSVYDRTTGRLDEQMQALVELDRALLAVGDPAAGLMYGFGGGEALEQHYANYEEVRTWTNRALDELERVVSPPGREILDRARASWLQMDEAVMAAPELVASGAVSEVFASGEDPFAETVWAPYNAIGAALVDLRAQTVEDLQDSVSSATRVQQAIPPVLAAALALALLLAWLAARQIAARVLRPILELRKAAQALENTDTEYSLELHGATAELHDLAAAINETAQSLRATHGMLRNQANTDALTGLANRKAFSDQLEAALDAGVERRVAVLFVDLDDFKVVNDSRGHAAGDELLRVVASRLSTCVRHGELVARLGGDEFAVLLDCTDDPAAPTVVADRILTELQKRIEVDDAPVRVGCSVGITVGGPRTAASDADELMRQADFAMYMAKSQGKNCFEVYSSTMHHEMVANTELKRALARAAASDQLVLHYQPVVDLSSGDVLGFEALVRWEHPTRGLLAPGAFIPLAEETGDIVEIGTWVVEEACRQLRSLQDQCPDAASVWMSVNISAAQITGDSFVDMIKSALRRHEISPGSLIVEITEAVAMTSTAAAATALAELREFGVHIALDDFGVGFSSLRYLQDLPVDVIKIDRSFVTNIEGKSDSMLEAIVTLARRLGLDIIAEGIEQDTELNRLRQFGQLAGQGFLFARPMPGADAVEFPRLGAGPASRQLPSPSL